LLNKTDLFKQKCKAVNLKDYFDGGVTLTLGYEGSNDAEKIAEFFRAEFEARAPGDRRLKFHMTTATDTLLMTKIINDIREFITVSKLAAVGFM
jgi:hypothetical protein